VGRGALSLWVLGPLLALLVRGLLIAAQNADFLN
jgi:hypothetical protein